MALYEKMINEGMGAVRAVLEANRKGRGGKFKIKDCKGYVDAVNQMTAGEGQSQEVIDLHVQSVNVHYNTFDKLTDTIRPEDDPFVEHYQTPPILEILYEEDAAFKASMWKFIDAIAENKALIGREAVRRYGGHPRAQHGAFWLFLVNPPPQELHMIRENIRKILEELPEGVSLEGAAKTRAPEEILEAIEAGLEIIGENYVQEAEKAYQVIGDRARWHMIGHLQRNKAKKAVTIFDMIETVDSMKLAREIDKCSQKIGKIMPILIEVNSGEESQKAGVLPEDVQPLIDEMRALKNIKIKGLMTMGPFTGDPEDSRPNFQRTREIFERLKEMELPGVEMDVLSMGMSNSYRVALEEGANLVRIGTKLFGERHYA